MQLNYPSEWRLQLAKKAANRYALNQKLRAVVVAGSVARGWADDWSDIELDLFWALPPSDRDRLEVVEALQGEVESFCLSEQDEWSETFILSGIKFEISSFLVSTMDEYIDRVMLEHDTDVDKHLRLAALHCGIPLFGQALIAGWQARLTPYPDELAETIIRQNIEFGGWNGVEMLFARGDLLLAFDLMVKVQKQVLAVLLALNRMYMAHPRGKWLERVAADMELKPELLAERFLFALRDGSVAGAREMHTVLEDTFSLVEAHFPMIDTTAAKRDARTRRVRSPEGGTNATI